MLFTCTSLCDLWAKVANALETQITWFTILVGGDVSQLENKIISLICYLIYKKYLSERTGNISHTSILQYMKKELSLRVQIYNATICKVDIQNRIVPLINSI